MTKQYEETLYDLEARMLVTEGMAIMKQFKEGDYINLVDSVDDYDYRTDKEGLFFRTDYIDASEFFSEEEQEALEDDLWVYEDEDEEEYEVVPKIKKIYKVVDVVNEIPIIREVGYSGEEPHWVRNESLLAKFYGYVNNFSDLDLDIENGKQVMEDGYRRFATLDHNFADSIILESTYIPYQGNEEAIEAFRKVIYDFHDKEVDAEMKMHLQQLSYSDLQYAKDIRKERNREKKEASK